MHVCTPCRITPAETSIGFARLVSSDRANRTGEAAVRGSPSPVLVGIPAADGRRLYSPAFSFLSGVVHR